MYPHPNPLRAKLEADQCIVGIYIQIPGADGIELAAAAGFDYVIIDEEHGPFGFADTVQMIRAAEARGICPIVRVPDQSPSGIRKALEAGALGVYVPDIRTAAQARAAIAAIKFGRADGHAGRGACPTIRAAPPGTGWKDFVQWNDANVMACLLIESRQGLDNLDEILAVPGLDTALLGRFDLAHELGLYGDRYGSAMAAVFEDFAARAQRAGVPFVARIKPAEPRLAREECADWVRRGARIFNAGSDREFLAQALCRAIAPLRGEAASGCRQAPRRTG